MLLRVMYCIKLKLNYTIVDKISKHLKKKKKKKKRERKSLDFLVYMFDIHFSVLTCSNIRWFTTK